MLGFGIGSVDIMIDLRFGFAHKFDRESRLSLCTKKKTDLDYFPMNMPSNSAALLTSAKAHPLEVGDVPYPTVVPNSVIIKTAAVAVNPVDLGTADLRFHTSPLSPSIGCRCR